MPRHFIRNTEHGLPCFPRQTRIQQTLQHRERRGRRFLGGFQNHRAAGSDRRAELAPGIADRKIPRCEGGHRPHRLVGDGGARAGGTHQLTPVQALALAGVKVEQANDHHHLKARLGQRLALLQRGNARDLFLALDQQASRAGQHRRALLRRRVAPDVKAALRGCRVPGPDRLHRPAAARRASRRWRDSRPRACAGRRRGSFPRR